MSKKLYVEIFILLPVRIFKELPLLLWYLFCYYFDLTDWQPYNYPFSSSWRVFHSRLGCIFIDFWLGCYQLSVLYWRFLTVNIFCQRNIYDFSHLSFLICIVVLNWKKFLSISDKRELEGDNAWGPGLSQVFC